MKFYIKTKEICLLDGRFDGYETEEIEVDDTEVMDLVFQLVEKEFGKGTINFIQLFDLDLKNELLEYYEEEIYEWVEKNFYEGD